MDVITNGVPPKCDILTNSPALHSLKRQQLVQLCKRNGIKASGKNAEIVEKLKAHALNMHVDPSMLSEQPFSSDDNQDKENRRIAPPRPSDQWTVIEGDSREIERVHLGLKDIREEVEQEMGTISSFKSFGASQSSGEFGRGTTSSKGSSMNLSLKAFTTSLKRSTSKLSIPPTPSTKLSSAPTSTMFPMHSEEPPINDLLATTSTPYHEHPHTYPLLPDPAPLDADDSRDQSMLELGASTIRLVTPAPTAESPPALRPFTPAFEPSYSPGSPFIPSSFASLPVEPDSDPNPPGAFPSVFSTPSAPPKPSTSQRSPAPPFLFGSPAHRISNTDFNSAAVSVLAEMNARLGLTGTTSAVGLDILQNRHAAEQSAASARRTEKPRTDVTSKFDKAHEREFERMEGLGAWYAKRGAGSLDKPGAGAGKKRKSDVLGGPARRPVGPSNARGRRSSRVVTPGTRRSLVAAAVAEEVDGRRVKRVRISTVDRIDGASAEGEEKQDVMEVDEETQKANEEREKERAAIKKKLEVSRARRRSSMGRVSVGAGRPPLIPNQPKKGIATKFGFLSSAKTLVKNVWNRGVGASAPQPPKPAASTLPKPTNTAISKKPTPNVLTKVPPASKPAAAKAATAKAPMAKADPNTSLRVPSTGLSFGRKLSTRTRTESSVGTKSSMASSAGTRTSTVSSTNSGAPGARRQPIPSFQPQAVGRASRANSLVSGGTAGSRMSAIGTTSSRGGSIGKLGSMGIRKSGLSAETGAGSTSSGIRKRTSSTLFAPTASSLARMQSTVKPPSMPGAANASMMSADGRGLARVPEQRPSSPNGMPSFTFTSSPRVGGTAAPSKGAGSIFPDGTPTFAFAPTPVSSPAPAPAPKPRALPPRRPRISRSRVIARVGAQRAASGSSLASTASARRSLNVAKPRGSLSARASGIGAKSREREAAAALNARKRLRQSEILRRRSRVGGLSPTLKSTAREAPDDGQDSDADGDRYEERSMTLDVSMDD